MFGKIEINEIIKKITKKHIDTFLVVVAVILGVYLGWENMEVIIFALFVWSILNPIPSRYFALGALLSLSLMILLLVLKKELRAEEFAIYAYYFLVLTTIMGIYELREGNKD